MFSIGEDFWIEKQAGERAFKVDGKALRVRDTLMLQDPSGNELFKVQKKDLRVRDTMEIERDGNTIATVKKALVHVVRDRFSVEVDGGEDLEATGNIVDHEYKVERDGDHVAEVSKRWFRVPGTYGLEIVPRPRRRADPRCCRLHRPDVPRLNAPARHQASATNHDS